MGETIDAAGLLERLRRLPRGGRTVVAIAGAPGSGKSTLAAAFVGGLDHSLARLRTRDEAFVAVPVFDRAIEIARAGARLIPAGVPVIVAEGNYLLLKDAPWSALARHFELTVRLDVPEDVLRARL